MIHLPYMLICGLVVVGCVVGLAPHIGYLQSILVIVGVAILGEMFLWMLGDK